MEAWPNVRDIFAYEYFTNYKKNKWDYEQLLRYISLMFIHKGDNVIDVGANVGLHTVPFANIVERGGRVYAFEPIPSLSLRLKEITHKLPVQVYQLAATNEAMANEYPTASFCHVQNHTGISGFLRQQAVTDELLPIEISVNTSTLDRIIPADEKISFIKIDVEGAEFMVLQGAERILRSSKPIVIFEFKPSEAAKLYKFSPDTFFSFFDRMEYTLFNYLGGKFTPDLWEHKYTFISLWAIPNNSPHMSFFEHNLRLFSYHYAKKQLQLKTYYTTQYSESPSA